MSYTHQMLLVKWTGWLAKGLEGRRLKSWKDGIIRLKMPQGLSIVFHVNVPQKANNPSEGALRDLVKIMTEPASASVTQMLTLM